MADMERKLTNMIRVHTEWEVEVGVGTMALRAEDQAWARRMYEEGHKGGRKWAQHEHHAHQAEHILYCCGTVQASVRCRVPTSVCGRQHVKKLMR